ncbi:biotin-dependent carboxyltransferase family protein [Aquibacillus salsiterrae]|uniref:Biotin-dependent carboxyltransferase family protein n=1 Tax=Aquibacillus salsiterrae TaxID=2950439 RepID=A0A9X3WC47_9BACI|nr:biotin-dependent carboxyltransferase family protein [Aquibacillus salsiterrae]MDC3416098.1 biotin-dependent carboxyltransferase family protein [Aquibacillus salsiterrae]
MGMVITDGGFFTTVQDLGRFGLQSLGFSVTGAMDQLAMRLANIVLNNEEDEAVLEMCLVGPSITFEQEMVIALTGADMTPKLNDKYISMARPLQVKKGDTLSLGTAKTGMYSYLAVKGGFQLDNVLGSKSTDTKIGIGGFKGRPLQPRDYLPIFTPTVVSPLRFGLSHTLFDYITVDNSVIQFIEGRQYNWFQSESKRRFETESYQLSTKSDRMGYRLTGKQLSLTKPSELLTEASPLGTIQVPASGEPIILMADRQPTGGYPKIGQIIETDLPIISQLRPSKTITFHRCSIDEARERLIKREQEMKQVKAFCNLKWKEYE